MKKIKNLVLSFSSVLLLTIGGLSVLPISSVFAAGPYTCTWTGATDTNFSTATNWSGCNGAAPQPGDDDNLVFDDSSNTNLVNTINDDISGLTLNNITFQGSTGNGFDVTGDSITLLSGITDNGSVNANNEIDNNLIINTNQTFTISNISPINQFYLGGVLSGTGNIAVTGGGELLLNSSSPSYSGNISDNDGGLSLDASTSPFVIGGSVTITNGATLIPDNELSGTAVFNVPINVSGNGSTLEGPPIFASYSNGGTTTELAGSITLGSNVSVGGYDNYNVDITGPLSGPYTITTTSLNLGVSLNQAPNLIIASSDNTSNTPNSSSNGGSGNTSESSTSNSTGSTKSVKTPDTGASLSYANYAMPFTGLTMIAGGIYIISKKLNKKTL